MGLKTTTKENDMAEQFQQIIDELTYRSYAHNREANPEIAPERWALIFDRGYIYEARYLALATRSASSSRMAL